MRSWLRTLAAFVVLGLPPTPAKAQTHPDFSGTWELASSTNPLTAPRLSITQTRAALAIDIADPQAGKMMYLLDGTDSRTVVGVITTTAAARWEGNTLAVTLDRTNGTVHWQERETYALEDRDTLVVGKTAESKITLMSKRPSLTPTIRSVYKRH